MNQLVLALQQNYQANLADFCWGSNLLLKNYLENIIHDIPDRIIYLWGAPGCGKSHLLQACCQLATQTQQTAAYLPLALLKDWDSSCLEDMDKLRLIALDDLESIAGQAHWEEAIFHLFNRVRDNETTSLILASTLSPRQLQLRLPDLKSRLLWGLVFHIADLEDHLKITALQTAAQKRGFILPPAVAFFLINRCSRNMHHLFKILDQLDHASLAAKRKITLPFVKSILQI